MQERRADRRADFHGWVELTTSRGRARGAGCDLSVGGLGLELRGAAATQDAPLAAAVTSEFALPGISLPLALEGVIAWNDAARGRLGVRFERVDPSVAELLESYVAGRF